MIKVFTHNDLDGAACAVLAKAFYGPRDPKISVSYVNYDTVDEEVINFVENNKFDLLLITDITPSREAVSELDRACDSKKIQLFDHHVTRSWVESYSWAKFDKDFCGASLFFSTIKKEFVKQDTEKFEGFIKAVEAWDIWKTKSKHRKRGENLNMLYKFLGTERFVHEFMRFPKADKEDSAYTQILSILKDQKEKYVEKVISEQLNKTEYKMDGFGNTFKILFCTDYFSEVGHAALNDPDSEDLKYVVLVNPVYNSCSLRSRGDVDVSAIAKLLKGGGHKSAAGFAMVFRGRLEKSIHNRLLSIN